MEVGATVSRRGGEWYAEHVTTKRTARRIMEGSILVPQKYLGGTAWFEGK
jgi:2-methylaconitate cis-trans-isomerase PrpF